MLRQISVFIENKPGRLEEVTGLLARERINLHALSIADTTDFGILRMIVSDPVKAAGILKEKGLMVKVTDVLAVAMGHQSGSLHRVLQILKALDISIEYVYAFASRHREYDAFVILRLNDQETAMEKLKDSGLTMLGQELLDQLNEG